LQDKAERQRPAWPVCHVPPDALQICERDTVPQNTGDEQQNSQHEDQLGQHAQLVLRGACHEIIV